MFKILIQHYVIKFVSDLRQVGQQWVKQMTVSSMLLFPAISYRNMNHPCYTLLTSLHKEKTTSEYTFIQLSLVDMLRSYHVAHGLSLC